MSLGEGSSRSRFFSITLILGIAYLMVFAHRFIPAVVAVDIGKDLSAGPIILGLLSSGYFYMYGLFQMPFGVIIDSVGPRKVLTFSFIVSGISALIFALAPTPLWSVVSRFMLGFGCAPALIAAMTLLARHIPKEKFPFYLSLLYFIGGLGPLVAASPLAYLSSHMGWRGACLSIAVVTLLYSIILYATVRDYPKGYKPEIREKKGMFKGIKTVATSLNFWLMVIIGIGIPSIYLVYCGLWAGPFLTDVYGFQKSTVGSVLSFGAIGAIIGFILGPFLADKVLKSRKKVVVIFGTFLFITLLPFILEIRLSFPLLCIQALCIGVFSGGNQPVISTVIKDMFPINITGTALGMFNTFPLLIGGLLQLLIGVIISIELKGTTNIADFTVYSKAFLIMPVLCFVGIISGIIFKDKKN